ncbi:MAG: hypothetical protein R3351_05190 [Nitrospirales bacterium]|nr:hypothetical protein [Nitrospirales bacterium]
MKEKSRPCPPYFTYYLASARSCWIVNLPEKQNHPSLLLADGKEERVVSLKKGNQQPSHINIQADSCGSGSFCPLLISSPQRPCGRPPT